MRKPPPEGPNLALRLMRMGPPGAEPAGETPLDSLKRSCEALRPDLVRVVGRDGFRALLARALALGKTEFPWLDDVQVDANGSLSGLDEAAAAQQPAEVEAGCACVLTRLLGLLAAFVGPELTRQFVSSGWPDTRLRATDFDTEEAGA